MFPCLISVIKSFHTHHSIPSFFLILKIKKVNNYYNEKFERIKFSKFYFVIKSRELNNSTVNKKFLHSPEDSRKTIGKI